MKVYGTPICIHCRHYKAIQKERGFEAEFIDITKNTDNLKKFLAMRDEEPLFEQVKKNHGIGIPFFVNEDGRKTFDLNEALSWMGEKPVDPKAVFEEGGKKDLALYEKYEFRNVRNGEAEEAAALEAACFPANEACTLPIMRQRVSVAADLFVVAVEKSTGKIAGFVNAIATNENTLRDEFFTDIRLHDPAGKYIMILSVAVLPEHRRQGLAQKLMWELLSRQKEAGRVASVLTCVEHNVKLYQKMGYADHGISQSSWGGEQWHEMVCMLPE